MTTMPLTQRNVPIIVAEDNFLTARLLSASLQKAGYQTVLARDGDEVLRLVQKYDPDLLLLNLNLTRPSGVEVLRALAPRRLRLRVLALTGSGQADLRSSATRLGVSTFFETPFNPEELASGVQILLKK